MGQVSIILIAGLIFLFSADPAYPDIGSGVGWTVAVTAGLVFLPALLAYLFGLFVTREVSPDQRLERIFLFRHLLFGFELLILMLYAVDVFYFHLLALINHWFEAWPFPYTRQVLGILPLLVGMVAIYLAYYEVESRVHASGWTRWGYLRLRFRLLLLPLLPLFAYLALLDLVQSLPLTVRLVFIRYPYLSFLMLLLLLVGAYVRSADLLQWLWPASPLPEGSLRRRLEALVARTGLRVRDILIWHTQGTPIANAAVTGLWGRFRYILITEHLLQSLSPEEIEGVVAHELGHVRHHHLSNYLIYSISYFFCYAAVNRALEPLYEKWPHVEILDAIITLLFFSFYFVILFRYLSRQFEHQADLYAVWLTRDPEALLRALRKLAQLNRIPRSTRRWMELFHTHPSIEQRHRLIERALNDDPQALAFLRTLPVARAIRLLAPLTILLFFPFVHELFASPVAIHREISRQYALERRYPEAIHELQQALQRAPGDPEILYEMALLHYEAQHWAESKRLLERILQTHPQHRAAQELLNAVEHRRRQDAMQKEAFP